MKLKDIEKINIENKEKSYSDYLVINEKRLNSYFIHIVPKELISISLLTKKIINKSKSPCIICGLKSAVCLDFWMLKMSSNILT